jgi:hypothetical protein
VAYRGAEINDPPRAYLWFWDITEEDAAPLVDPELLEELSALGYV